MDLTLHQCCLSLTYTYIHIVIEICHQLLSPHKSENLVEGFAAIHFYVSTKWRSRIQKFISTSNKLFLYNQNKCAVKEKADASGKKIFSQHRLLKISILLKLTSAFMQNNSKNTSLSNIPDDILVLCVFLTLLANVANAPDQCVVLSRYFNSFCFI